MRVYSFLLVLLILLIDPPSQAQVTLSLQVPPVGVMLKSQLWNMALINTGANIYVSIKLTLISEKNNQPVLQAATAPLLLNKGVNPVTPRNLGPVQYTYLSSGINIDRNPNGFLAVGNYRACYTVSTALENNNYTIAEDCLPVEVQPLSPPQLNLPADTATLQTAYPQFTWLPPLPLNLFSDLQYDMLVVEVLPGQGPYEAVQKNIPVYNISNYKSLVNAYPASYKALDTGRVYAWRVIARNEGQFIAQSEVWTFRLAAVSPPVLLSVNGNYLLLRKSNESSAGIYVLQKSDAIGIRYYSYEKDHSTAIRFLTGEGKAVQVIQQKIVYGDNFLVYPLNRAFEKGKLYIVELTDAQANKYTARFTFNK